MRLLIFGATGGVGRPLTERALEQGHEVTAVERDPAKLSLTHPGLLVAQGDVTDPASVRTVIKGHDMVFCTLGTGGRGPTTLFSTAARNVTRAMDARGVRRLMFLSNFGVLDERAPDLLWAVMMPFARVWLRHLLRDHRLALEVIRQYDWEWMAVRPMIMTDGPSTGRYRIAVEGLPPHGVRISRADVADFMLLQVNSDEYVHQIPALAY